MAALAVEALAVILVEGEVVAKVALVIPALGA